MTSPVRVQSPQLRSEADTTIKDRNPEFTIKGYLEPLRQLARHLSVTEGALQHAQELALGTGDILVLLLEPLHVRDYITCPEAIRKSPTLKELSRVLQEYSRGTYDISNTCILDIRPFRSAIARDAAVSNDQRLDQDEAAYATVETMVKILQPKVIVTCQCATKGARNDFARRMCSSTAGKSSVGFVQIGARRIPLVYAFHPSCFLRQEYQIAVGRRHDLKHSFRVAFQKAFEILNDDLTSTPHGFRTKTLPQQPPSRICDATRIVLLRQRESRIISYRGVRDVE